MKGLEMLAVIGGGIGLFVIGSYIFYKGNEFVSKMASDKASANYINENPLDKNYGRKD